MIWWISQAGRARSERSAVAELEESCEWLLNVKWRLTQVGALVADFEVVLNQEPVALELTYPRFFPDVPPQIRPKANVRLSDHQYGAGGELCLEYRPDNWEPGYTGAMMIESAYRLLTGEQPAPDESADVESAHRSTLGQDARGASMRFLLAASARLAMLEVPPQVFVEAELAEHLAAGHWLAFPTRIGGAEHPYLDASSDLPGWAKRNGFFIRLDPSLAKHVTPEWDFLNTLATVMNHEGAKARLSESQEELIFIVECSGTFTLMMAATGSGKRKIFRYRTVDMPADQARLPADYERLAEASVAIVGCGSIGSKLAASLARAGVGKFVLIDGDLLLPGNLVRNDLGWDAVGLNKPDAVKQRINEISPSSVVVVHRIGLGTQESSGATDAALTQAGSCSVIVEATADPQVFNLCGAVARNEKKVLVWGEVFAGGIGGMIARLRPGIEPVPHAARRQLLQWCADRGKPLPEGSELQYSLRLPDDAPPLVADDADVTAIAAYMTRAVIDSLLSRDSIFPYSAYAIGLRQGWIFDAPFDIWPIALVPEGNWGPQEDEDLPEQLEAFAKEFFPQAGDVDA